MDTTHGLRHLHRCFAAVCATFADVNHVVAWESLACENFARRSYIGEIITSTSARASPSGSARACTRTVPPPGSAAPRSTNGHVNYGTVRDTPAVTRSRVTTLWPVSVATRYGGSRNNNRATLAKLFEAGTLQRLSKIELELPCYTEDIAYLVEKASFNEEYAHVATNALGSYWGGAGQENNSEHLQAGDDPLTSGTLEGAFRQ